MAERWTMTKYRRYCRGTAIDMKSDYPDQVHDASIWYDVAAGVLSTEPELKKWLVANRFRGVLEDNLKAALADDLASGGKF